LGDSLPLGKGGPPAGRTSWRKGKEEALRRSLLATSPNLSPHLVLRGECALGLLHLAAQLLHGAVVLADVDALLLLVQLHEVLHDALRRGKGERGC
jgi:hypothetical protein